MKGSADTDALLKDPSGEIRGVIHQSVLEKDEFKDTLVPGSVMELANICIFKPTKARACLNITLSNVVSLVTIDGQRILLEQKEKQKMNGSESSKFFTVVFQNTEGIKSDYALDDDSPLVNETLFSDPL